MSPRFEPGPSQSSSGWLTVGITADAGLVLPASLDTDLEARNPLAQVLHVVAQNPDPIMYLAKVVAKPVHAMDDISATLADRRRRRLQIVAETGVADLIFVGPDHLPPVLLLPELARLLRCSESTIGRRIADGSFPIPPLPSIDRRPRWSRERVLDWPRVRASVGGDSIERVSRFQNARRGAIASVPAWT